MLSWCVSDTWFAFYLLDTRTEYRLRHIMGIHANFMACFAVFLLDTRARYLHGNMVRKIENSNQFDLRELRAIFS